MRASILTDFDSARETLEALAAFAGLDRGTVRARLLRDRATMRHFGVETLVPRWIERPLDALRAFGAARREVALALEGVKDWLAGLEARLAQLRSAGKATEVAALEREAARLLCFEAELSERLSLPDADLVDRARQGITRVLEVSLPMLARATIRYADVALQDPEPTPAERAVKHIENYLALAKRATTLTGGLDLPVLRSEYVAAVRARAEADAPAGPTSGARPSRLPRDRSPSPGRPHAPEGARGAPCLRVPMASGRDPSRLSDPV